MHPEAIEKQDGTRILLKVQTIVNSQGSGAEHVGVSPAGKAGPMQCPDQPSFLLAELEATRRQLAVANRRIAKLVRDRKRSRTTISRLQAMAYTDVVTDLANRRRFDKVLDANFALSVIRGSPLSVIMLDVDCFKSYNDTFGHSAGDVALRVIALHLTKLARASDVAARYGGDEFAVLLHEADATASLKSAERFRDAIESFRWPLRQITASFGVASRTPSIQGAAMLVDEADRALYHSKRGGRSRVIHLGMLEAGDASTCVTEKPAHARVETYIAVERAASGGSQVLRLALDGDEHDRLRPDVRWPGR